MEIRKFITAVLCLLVPAAVFSQNASVEKAAALFSSKEYSAALAELEKTSPVSQNDRETAAYYKTLCKIYLSAPDAPQAVDDYLKQYPASIRKVEVITAMADTYFNTGRYAEALDYYTLTDKFAINQKPVRDDFAYRKAYCQYATGDYAAARPAMYSLLQSERWGNDAAYAYGHMCYSEGDMTLALENFNRVAQDSKYRDKIPFYLANIYFGQKKYDRSIEEGEKLLSWYKGEQDTAPVRKIIGQSYFNLGRYDKALPYLEQSVSSPSASPTDLYQAGYAYYKTGDYSRAEEMLKRAAQGQPAVSQGAYYVLGDIYLKSGRKQEALGAFKTAGGMDHDKTVKHDAWYNYALLSYETGNPYASVPSVLSEYLRLYPESPSRELIYEYLLDSFISSREYEEAIRTIETLGLDSPRAEEALQKASFYLAGQKLNSGDADAALKYYSKAASSGPDDLLRARAHFWLAETYMRMDMNDKAASELDAFAVSAAGKSSPEYARLGYQRGYLASLQGDYKTAQKYFTAYGKGKLSAEERTDNNMRLADCAFALGQYQQALSLYNGVIKDGSPQADYATYQKALCEGVSGKYREQISTLNGFLSSYPESAYRPQARYDLGVAYQKSGQNDRAISSFLAVENEKSAGTLVPDAKVKAALAYYNAGNSDKALELYKEVVEKYPSSQVTPSAMRSARQIFVEQGRSDDFVSWSNSTSGTPLDEMAVDSLHYETAYKAFSAGNFPEAGKAFARYLEKYPSGLFTPDAAYYMAESALKAGDTLEAKKGYEKLLSMPEGKYTEGSLVKYTTLMEKSDSLYQAIPYLEKLFSSTATPENRKYAAIGLLRAYEAEQDWDNVIKYAGIVRRDIASDTELYADASVVMCGAYVENGQSAEAAKLVGELKRIVSGENMAKTLYCEAAVQYAGGEYDKSIETISRLTLDYPMYKYTGGRALLLMARNFHAQNDIYQAEYILKNIIESSPYQDIKDEARALSDYIASQKTDAEQGQNTDIQNDAVQQ